MDLQLKGKTALVTGSTAGIGFAIAQSLDREGARVIVNGRKADRVEGARAKLSSSAEGFVGDLGSAAGIAAVVERFPAVDILVNNLGIFEAVPAREISDDQWRTYFEVNVLAAVRLIRAYLPAMTERGR